VIEKVTEDVFSFGSNESGLEFESSPGFESDMHPKRLREELPVFDLFPYSPSLDEAECAPA
jgi:hypothetical protein